MPWTRFCGETICGTQACTVGDSKAASTDSSTSSAPITQSSLPSGSSSPAASTDKPDRASSATMMCLRLALSARIPPKGESRTVGSSAADSIPAKMEAEPVCSSTYIDRANLRV